MFHLDDEQNHAVIVGLGLIVAHLFIYGRKIKKNIRIKMSELVGDGMQLGAMYVGAMSFFSGLELLGLRPKDTWQIVMITILFAMSFETYFQRARDALQARFAAVTGALLGGLPDNTVISVPPGKGLPETVEVEEVPVDEPRKPASVQPALRYHVSKPQGDIPPDQQDLLDKMP